jgi:hypothetical protein
VASAADWWKASAKVGAAPFTSGASLIPGAGGAAKSVGGAVGGGLKRVGQAIGLVEPDKIDTSPLDDLTPALKEDKIRALEREGKIDAATAEAYRRALGLPPSHVVDPTYDKPELQADTEPGAVNAAQIARPGSTQVDQASDGDIAAPSKITYDASYNPVEARDPGRASMEDETTIDHSKVDGSALALRGQQLSAAESAKNAPSSAAAQFRAALMAAQEAQLGAASQARGADRGGARREAVLGIGRDALQGAEKSAELAAREQQAKNDSYANTLAGVSGHDVDVATSDAQLDSARALQQGIISSARARSNVVEANKRAIDKATLGEHADALNSKNRMEIKSETRLADTSNATNDLDRSKTKYLGGVDISKFNVGQTNLGRTSDADRTERVDTANVKATNDVQAGERLRRERIAAANALAIQNAALEHKKLVLEAQKSKDAADLARQNAIQAGASGMAGVPDLAGGATSNQIRLAEGKVGVSKADQENKTKSSERLVKGITDGGAAFAKSDERVKREVSHASTADLAALTDAFHAATFRYKGKHDDGEMHAGTDSAQAIEKTKLGKGLVTKDADGVRRLDREGLAMLLAAAAAKSTRRGN